MTNCARGSASDYQPTWCRRDWLQIDALPRTPSGKLDRNALPAPATGAAPQPNARIDYPTRLEADLAELWRDVLDVEAVERDANFFDLGGDSISAVRLTSAMQRLLDANVMLVAIFDAPTISGLADFLRCQHPAEIAARYREAVDARGEEPAHDQEVEVDAPLSYQQQSFWLLEQLYPDARGGNEQFIIPLTGPLDARALEQAWNGLLDRHEILRTVFRRRGDDVRQIVLPRSSVSLAAMRLTGESREACMARVRAAAAESPQP